jgi:hypothetical protein
MTRDDANFLAAAELAAGNMCLRAGNTFKVQPTVTLSHDEFSAIALAFDRAVQIAIDAHLADTGRSIR